LKRIERGKPMLLQIAAFTVATLTAQTFDPSWQRLPKGFKGDNIVSLAKALDTKKGEYESTEKFSARLAKLVPEGRVYIFLCDADPFKTEYNADVQEFSFSRLSFDPYIRVIEIKKHGKSYYGTNAFGVGAKISKLIKTTYAVFDPGWDRNIGVSFRLKVPSGSAKAFKKDFGFALVVTLMPDPDFGEKGAVQNGTPYLRVSYYQSEPTVSNAIDYDSTTYALVADVQSVVVFRTSDRSVLLVASPKKLPNRNGEVPSMPVGSAVAPEGKEPPPLVSPSPVPKTTTSSAAPIFKESRPPQKAWDIVASQSYTNGCIRGLAVKYGTTRTPDQIKYACECVTWHLEDRFSWGEMTEAIQSGGLKILEVTQSASAECKKNRPPELGPDPG
jgi:hypothetical protein